MLIMNNLRLSSSGGGWFQYKRQSLYNKGHHDSVRISKPCLIIRFGLAVLLAFFVTVPISGCETGGAHHELVQTSVAPTNTVGAPYDVKVINAVQFHWMQLLDTISSPSATTNGEVVIEFHLHADGNVSDLRVARSRTDETTALVCQKAVSESAPFPAWPQEMRRAFTNDYRDIHFTFYIDRQ